MNFRKLTYLACTLCGLLLASCQKTTQNLVTTASDSEEQTVLASDELKINNEIDNVIDDAVHALCISPTTSGGTGVHPFNPFHIYIDTSAILSGIIYITYAVGYTDSSNGRQGNIVIKLPVVGSKIVPWTTKGVTATIGITATGPSRGYEVTYNAASTISLWFIDTIKVTNTSGGLLTGLVTGDSLTEKVNAAILFTHNDNIASPTVFPWNVNKERVITLPTAGNTTVITRTDTVINGSNVVDWGTNCENEAFYTVLQSPMVQDISVTPFYGPLSGVKLVQGIPEPLTITFGVNAAGTPVTGTPYGYKFTWSNSSGPQQVILAY